MSAPETRYARTEDGFHIAYQVTGEGPVDLVYIPGWFSNVDLMWDEPEIAPFLRRLARSTRLIVFDRRGTGISDEVADAPNLDEMLDDIRAVMDATRSERAVLVGATVGAAIACLFAATYPERTLGIALIQSSPRTAEAADFPWGDTMEEYRDETDRIDAGWGTGEFERWFLGTAARQPDDDAAVARAARYLRNGMTPRSAVLANEMWIQTDVRDVLPAVHVPALVFEMTRQPEISRYLVDHLPLGELVSLPGEFRTPWTPGGERTVDELLRFAHRVHAQASGLDRVLATVLFTDIVDSTATSAALGDARWRETRVAHDRAVRAHLARFRGREVKTLGDGFLATFDGPARAVQCATAIAQAVRPLGIEVRAGVHTGEIELDGDDVAGLAVAIAARVAATAGAGEVLTSQTVKDLTAGSGLTYEDAGERELKGVPDRWRLYRVVG
jgi:class 3 adenylate cyclase/pimeloyl-ACP methyl ester carboxylesterase